MLFLANSSASSSHIVSVLCVRVDLIDWGASSDKVVGAAATSSITTVLCDANLWHRHVVWSLRTWELRCEVVFHLRGIHQIT